MPENTPLLAAGADRLEIAREENRAAQQALAAEIEPYLLTPEQLTFFETFGFLKIPGLFADEMADITSGFEEIFASVPAVETREWLHFDDERHIIPTFIDQSPRLTGLKDHPKVLGIVNSILGPDYEWANSDGNLFFCDSSWHADIYAAPMSQYHLKVSFYLDPLRADSGAIRMLPGTNHYRTEYAARLLRTLQHPDDILKTYGVPADQIPGYVLETDPGDIVLWAFRTIHASFGGRARRRLFSLNYRQIVDDAN